jgi:hypothetical protein
MEAKMKETNKSAPAKKVYQTPVLTLYGTVSDLTRQRSSSRISDSGNNRMAPPS